MGARRQDTFDLRSQLSYGSDGTHLGQSQHSSDDELAGAHSMIEDDSDLDARGSGGLYSDEEEQMEEEDDDRSSSLSIPNESIDFDLVYSLHSFAATVEGQASVVKGDSLVLMDDSNSYWWLVRVLKTQEIGYIPAENIETPFERLARLNKHRNVDLASATQAEMQNGLQPTINPRSATSPTTRSQKTRSVIWDRSLYFSRYPPAIWRDLEEGEDEDEGTDDDEWAVGTYAQERLVHPGEGEPGADGGDSDGDGMSWEDAEPGAQREAAAGAQAAIAEEQRRLEAEAQAAQQQQDAEAERAHQARAQAEEQRRQQLAAQQAQQQQQQQQAQQQQQQVRRAESREQVLAAEPGPGGSPASRQFDPAGAPETRKISVTPSVAQDTPSRETLVSPSPGGSQRGGPAKLTKERPSIIVDDDNTGKRAKPGLFGKIFGGRKEKHKDKGGNGSVSEHAELGRPSDDSGRSSSTAHLPPAGQPSPAAPALQSVQSPASQHAQQLRNRDQEQMALYQQYLNRSPASPPEVQPLSAAVPSSASTQSALSPQSAEGPGGGARRARPGSLLIQPGAAGGDAPVPELSVIRVFAGKKVQTEATFKTVLLNSTTSAGELVRQAMQRFRLPQGEDPGEYYLTVKQVEGASAALRPDERPLLVFETLAEAAAELPKVKRSSVGSISSIASNLSMHPAIKKLPMNDFTDDSAVKFYLNRRGAPGDESALTDEGDITLTAESVAGDEPAPAAERLGAPPGARFALKLLIHPGDLPDDMVFDPVTEAIVFKHTLRERAAQGTSPAAFRRKVFLFPRNITVAEVIEIGLERFGISEGVVDGGDEVEDKTTKRRSAARVRYVLKVAHDGKERELSMGHKVLDAFPRAPAFKSAERRPVDAKRRSVDSMQILGSADDAAPDDPTFVLRRATTYRPSGSRHPAPLDDVALHRLHAAHRDSASSTSSAGGGAPEKPLSRAELIAAQREAQRASQRAMLGAHANHLRGTDVRLPGGALLRSARDARDGRMRYAYGAAGAGARDVTAIVEDELRAGGEPAGRRDLLAGAAQDERLARVLARVRASAGAPALGAAALGSVASLYSGDGDGEESEESETDAERARTPTNARERVASPGAMGSRNATPVAWDPRAAQAARAPPPHLRSESSASVMSGESGYRTAVGSPTPVSSAQGHARRNTQTPTQAPKKARVYVPRDDFGVQHVLARVELAGLAGRAGRAEREKARGERDVLEDALFGRDVGKVVKELHPAVREVYGEGFRRLEEMDRALDELLMSAVKARG